MRIRFDAKKHEPTTSVTALPSGDYQVVVKSSALKASKAGTSEYLQLQLQVVDGEYRGYIIFDQLIVVHDNPIVTDIANRRLSALCHATNQLLLEDTNQLHGIPVIATVSFVEKTEKWGEKNDVRNYTEVSGASTEEDEASWEEEAQQEEQEPKKAKKAKKVKKATQKKITNDIDTSWLDDPIDD